MVRASQVVDSAFLRLCLLLTVALLTIRPTTGHAVQPDEVGDLYAPASVEQFYNVERPRYPVGLSLSPSGQYAVIISARRIGSTVIGSPTLELLDLRTQERRALTVPDRLSFRDADRVQWDEVSRRVGILQIDGSEDRRFYTWSFDTDDGISASVALPALRGKSVLHWTWIPNDNLILAGTRSIPQTGIEPVQRYDTSQAWAWYWSVEVETRRRARAGRAMATFSLLQISTTTGELRIGSRALDFPIHPSTLGQFVSWNFDDLRQVVIFSQRGLAGGDDLSLMPEYRNHLATNGQLNSDATQLLQWSILGNVVTPMSETGSGAVVGAYRERLSDRVVFNQEEPQWSAWPVEGRWGRLRVRESDGRVGIVGTEPLHIAWPIWPGPDEHAVYVHANPARGRVYRIDLRRSAMVDMTPRGMSISAFSVSGDGVTALAILESVGSPPRIARFDGRTQSWEPVGLLSLPPPEDFRAEFEYYHWRSRDGRFELGGVLVKPANFDPSIRYPMVVNLVGRRMATKMAARNIYDPWIGYYGVPAQLLADAGYVVFYPNHRGVGELDASFGLAHVGRAGDHYNLDVDAGIDALVAEGWVDPERLAIIGTSAGSEIMSYAISHTSRFRAAISEDGPLLMAEMVAAAHHESAAYLVDGPEAMTRLLGFSPFQRRYSDPMNIRTPLLLRWDARPYVSEGTAPNQAMMTTGPALTFNTLAQTQQLVATLSMNGVPVEVVMDRDIHGVANPQYRFEYITRVMNWIDYFVREIGDNPIPARSLGMEYSPENSPVGASDRVTN